MPPVVPARHGAVQGEGHRVDDGRFAGAGRADQREVVGVGEVDRSAVAEGGEAVHVQPNGAHVVPRPGARRVIRRAAASNSVCTRVVGDALRGAVVGEQLAGERSGAVHGRARRVRSRRRTPGRCGPPGRSAARRCTSSRSPALVGSLTYTRRSRRRIRPARATSSATVPRTVRSRRPRGDRHVGDLGRRRRGRPRPGRPRGCCPARRSRPRTGRRSTRRGRRGQRLPPVQVAERHVMRFGREDRGRHVVFQDRLCASARRRRTSPPVTVRCAITTLTASGVNARPGWRAPRGPCRRSRRTSRPAVEAISSRRAPRTAGTGTAAPRR